MAEFYLNLGLKITRIYEFMKLQKSMNLYEKERNPKEVDMHNQLKTNNFC